jgi:hypothetical protein
MTIDLGARQGSWFIQVSGFAWHRLRRVQLKVRRRFLTPRAEQLEFDAAGSGG